MKISPLLLCSLTLWAVGQGTNLHAAPSDDVTIQYVQPEKFTDFRIYGRDSQWSASYFASQISGDLKPLLNRRFPGAKLKLRFTDIDLAGREQISPSGRNVRASRREVAPARMSFEFLLQDSGSRTIASGSTRITDSSYSRSPRGNPERSEPLYYEKQMMKKWLNSVQTKRSPVVPGSPPIGQTPPPRPKT